MGQHDQRPHWHRGERSTGLKAKVRRVSDGRKHVITAEAQNAKGQPWTSHRLRPWSAPHSSPIRSITFPLLLPCFYTRMAAAAAAADKTAGLYPTLLPIQGLCRCCAAVLLLSTPQHSQHARRFPSRKGKYQGFMGLRTEYGLSNPAEVWVSRLYPFSQTSKIDRHQSRAAVRPVP